MPNFSVKTIAWSEFEPLAGRLKQPECRPGSIYFGAFDPAGVLAGVAEIRRAGKTSVLLESLYVLPEYRRQGAGGALVDCRLSWCRENAIRKARASCLFSSLGLFLARGFRETVARKNGAWVEKLL